MLSCRFDQGPAESIRFMQHEILQHIVILLTASVVAVVAFRRFKLPPILAYILVGVMVGPHGTGWIQDSADTRFLAEFGVVFLLFTLGLEFSIPQLVSMRREVFGLGGTQVVLTTIVVAVTAWMFGISPEGAIILGGTLALSSTAIVIKQLTEQLETNSRHGRLSVAILIFQDLAVVPFLILIPVLAGDASNSLSSDLIFGLAKGVGVLLLMIAIGHWLLRPLFHEIAKAHSSELFTLAVLLFALAAAWATHLSGLSLALGAFLAGMMLGETEFRHQVEADIRPLRDVLLGLFFITIGMLLNINTLLEQLHWVLLLVTALIAFKLLSIMAITMATGNEKAVALRTGMCLAQGGEFGFALLALAFSSGLLSDHSSQLVLAAVIISMAIAPFMIRFNGSAAKKLFAKSYGDSRQRTLQEVGELAEDLNQHILILGYGRIGQNIARFLEQEGFRFIALDLDPVRVREAREAGENVIYGDSTHLEILEAAGIHRARAMVVSYDDVHATEKVLKQIKEQLPHLPVLVRTRDDANLERLLDSGATEVVPETLEASLMLSSYLLMLLDVPIKRIVKHVQDVRTGRYEILRQFFHGQEVFDLSDADTVREGLHTVNLDHGAFAIGRKLGELELAKCSVSVTSVRRGENLITKPSEELLLQRADVLVLYGTPEDIAHAEALLLSGG